MKLSILVPVFNEVRTVEELLARVERVPLEKEIVVVDDGSTDGTRELLAGYAGRPGYVVRHHERNRGKGRAIRTALEAAGGDVVVIQDADLEYDPQDFVRMLAEIREGGAQAVYGSRWLRPENRHEEPLYYLGGLVVTWAARLLYGLRITDEATCYKMIDASLLRSLDLACERFEFCPEVTAKLAKRRVPIREVPIAYAARRMHEGKKIGWRDAVEAIWTLVRLRVRR